MLYFQDAFGDGFPPPNAPSLASGSVVSYFVQGTVGPERSGKLTIDSSGAVLTTLSSGFKQLFQQVRLLTNTDSSDLRAGLKVDDTFLVTGIFDLILPNPNAFIEQYGIGLTDITSTNQGDDDVRLMVRKGTDGAVRISFIQNPSPASTVIVASVLLDQSHQQIALTLSRPSAANNKIVASYAYIDNGIMGPSVNMLPTVDIFRGEFFTRARMIALTQFQ